MEQKLVKAPFYVELAKKITNGEIEGRVVTREGDSVRILCWDKKDKTYHLAALVDDGIEENYRSYTNEGIWNTDETCTLKKYDLMLEIPEYMTFKDGDILICECGTPFIYKDTKDRHGNFSAYCGIDLKGTIFFDMKGWTYSIKGYANEEQKKIIIDALKASKEPKAKEYLKRFFNIEVKPECEFKFRDVVLVRTSEKDKWCAAEFSHIESDRWYAVFGGIYYKYCIPYNEQTAHLLGTTDNWEE